MRASLGALLLVAGVGPALAQSPVDTAARLLVDPAVRVDTLPNGVVVYVRANREPESRAELRLMVNAGSVLEDDDQRGLAHVVEHMAFNGTRRFPRQSLVDFLERIGMRFGPHLNAFTSFDETVYQIRVPTDTAGALESALDILEDWATAVTFDPDEVERERGVVVEEWRLGLGAQDRIFKRQLPELFRGSRYADRYVIGTLESLQSFTREQLLRFYRDWYRPDLMGVIAVGDFEPDSVFALIRERFATIPGPTHPRPRPDFGIAFLDSTRVVAATDVELPYTTVTMTHRGPSHPSGTVGGFRRDLLLRLAESMLNQRLSELTQRPDPPFAAAIVGRQSTVRTADFTLLGAATSERGGQAGFEAVLAEIERAVRHGFTATELARVRDDVLRDFERAAAEREHTASPRFVAEYQAHFLEDEPIPGRETEYELAQALLPDITLAEVEEAFRELFLSRDRVILASAPDKPGVPPPSADSLLSAVERVQALELSAYEDRVGDDPLVATPPRPGRVVEERRDSLLGTITWTLENGVRVIARPTDFKADEVLLTASSPGGTSLAPDSTWLNAWLAADMIELGGLGEFDLIALQKKLAGRVASVSPSITSTREGLSGSASPRDLDLLLELVYLTMTAPRADGAAFQAFLQNARTALENRGADPEQVFADTVQVVLSQGHPRARPVSLAILDSLDLATAQRFYRDRFGDAGDFTFVLVGAFDPDTLRPLVEQWLGSLPSGGREESWRDAGIRPPHGVVERTVRKGIEPKSSTQLIFTGPGESTRANRAALRALAEVLQIRLRENLREALGATYGVSVGASISHEPVQQYSISIGFGSAPERSDELVEAIFAVIDSIRRAGPRPEDLVKVREAEVRSRQTALRQNGFWLSALAIFDQRGEDPSPIVEPRGDADLMTADAVRDAARRYLDPGNYIRVTLLPERADPPPEGPRAGQPSNSGVES